MKKNLRNILIVNLLMRFLYFLRRFKIFYLLINKIKLTLSIFSDKKNYKVINLFSFFELLFSANEKLTIVQIGANDGIFNDPINKYIKKYPKSFFYRIEALPYYFEKLKANHLNDENVQIINKAIISNQKEKNLEFFYIDPKVADQMDGDGPFNKWAHGQGSFFESVIKETIHNNRFRGSYYRKNIKKFISSIMSIDVEKASFDEILIDYNIKKIDILLMDVQGYEYQILKSFKSWSTKPKIIVYENDGSMKEKESKLCSSFLVSFGYQLLFKDRDACWAKKDFFNF